MTLTHQRCTKTARNATIQMCGLDDEFRALSSLMADRMDKFRHCVQSPAADATQLDLEEDDAEDINCAVLPGKPLIQPTTACWRGVSLLRQHCAQLARCCPSANACIKKLRDSAATKAVREAHLEINRKTLECRNLAQRRNANDERVDAVKSAQHKNTTMVERLSSSTENVSIDDTLRVYAAPRAKFFPAEAAPDFQFPHQETTTTTLAPLQPYSDVLVPFSDITAGDGTSPIGEMTVNVVAPMHVRQLKRFRSNNTRVLEERQEVNVNLSTQLAASTTTPKTTIATTHHNDAPQTLAHEDSTTQTTLTSTVISTTAAAMTTTSEADRPTDIPTTTSFTTTSNTASTLTTVAKGYATRKTVKTLTRFGTKHSTTIRTPIVEYVYKAALLRRRQQIARARLRNERQQAAEQHAVVQLHDGAIKLGNEKTLGAEEFVDLSKLLYQQNISAHADMPMLDVKEIARHEENENSTAASTKASAYRNQASHSGLITEPMANNRRAIKTSMDQLFPEHEMVGVLKRLRDRNNVYVARRRFLDNQRRVGVPLRHLPIKIEDSRRAEMVANVAKGQRTQLVALPNNAPVLRERDNFTPAELMANIAEERTPTNITLWTSKARINTSSLLRSSKRFRATHKSASQQSNRSQKTPETEQLLPFIFTTPAMSESANETTSDFIKTTTTRAITTVNASTFIATKPFAPLNLTEVITTTRPSHNEEESLMLAQSRSDNLESNNMNSFNILHRTTMKMPTFKVSTPNQIYTVNALNLTTLSQQNQVELNAVDSYVNVSQNGLFEHRFEGNISSSQKEIPNKLEGVKNEAGANNINDKSVDVLAGSKADGSDARKTSLVSTVSSRYNALKSLLAVFDSEEKAKIHTVQQPQTSIRHLTHKEDDVLFPPRSTSVSIDAGDARQQPFPQEQRRPWWPVSRNLFYNSNAGANVVPALFAKTLEKSHTLPRTLNLTRLAAARPLLSRLLRDREKLAHKMRRFYASGRVNSLGRELPTTDEKKAMLEKIKKQKIAAEIRRVQQRVRAYGAALAGRISPTSVKSTSQQAKTSWSVDGRLLPFWRVSAPNNETSNTFTKKPYVNANSFVTLSDKSNEGTNNKNSSEVDQRDDGTDVMEPFTVNPAQQQRTMASVRDWTPMPRVVTPLLHTTIAVAPNAEITRDFEESLFVSDIVGKITTTPLPIIDSDMLKSTQQHSRTSPFYMSNEIRRFPQRKPPAIGTSLHKDIISVDGSVQSEQTETRRPPDLSPMHIAKSGTNTANSALRSWESRGEDPFTSYSFTSSAHVTLTSLQQEHLDDVEFTDALTITTPGAIKAEHIVENTLTTNKSTETVSTTEISVDTTIPNTETLVTSTDAIVETTKDLSSHSEIGFVRPILETTTTESIFPDNNILTTKEGGGIIVENITEANEVTNISEEHSAATIENRNTESSNSDGSNLKNTTPIRIFSLDTKFTTFSPPRDALNDTMLSIRPLEETSTLAPSDSFKTETPIIEIVTDSGVTQSDDPFLGSTIGETTTMDTLLTTRDFSSVQLKHSLAIRIRPLNQTTETLASDTTDLADSSDALNKPPPLNSPSMSVISAILARKQLQRITVPNRATVENNGDTTQLSRLVGYRNKVLYVRRQLAAAIARQKSRARQTITTTTKSTSFQDGNPLNTETIEGLNTANDSIIPSDAVVDPEQIGYLRNWQQKADIRRAFPISHHRTIPPPPENFENQHPTSATNGKDENAVLEELMAAKRTLVLNLEKFLRHRKEEIRLNTENKNENERLNALRRSRQYDERGQLTGYCELYSTCADQLKFVQRKCGEPNGLASATGRLLPGLPKRRFGPCNAKLLVHYQRVDTVRAELEENVENCLVEKIATRGAQISKSCTLDWPLLPTFEAQSSCAERIAVVQNHCKKLARCCTSLDTCQKSVENFALARRLHLEEERLSLRAAECQVNAHEEYRQLRQLLKQQDEQGQEQRHDEQLAQPTAVAPLLQDETTTSASSTPVPYSTLNTRVLDRQISELSEHEPFRRLPAALLLANAPTTRVQSDPIRLTDDVTASQNVPPTFLFSTDGQTDSTDSTLSSLASSTTQEQSVQSQTANSFPQFGTDQELQGQISNQEPSANNKEQQFTWSPQQQSTIQQQKQFDSFSKQQLQQRASAQGQQFSDEKSDQPNSTALYSNRDSHQPEQQSEQMRDQIQARRRRQDVHRQEQKRRAVWRSTAKRRRRLRM